MRLSPDQRKRIKQEATDLFGPAVEVILFGSRADNGQRGGDIDIMIKTPEAIERPALMAARLSTRLSRLLDGRQVDVIILSSSLKRLPIHEIARANRSQAVKSEISRSAAERAHFLCRIVRKEAEHLENTSSRLFPSGRALTPGQVETWLSDPMLSERLDAFVARFIRLQDTVGDKLIPVLLQLTGEDVGPVIDNLNRAEKFGWLDSADEWMLYRKLRNQMVHEYIEDTAILTDALAAGRDFVPTLLRLSLAVAEEAEKRIGEKSAR